MRRLLRDQQLLLPTARMRQQPRPEFPFGAASTSRCRTMPAASSCAAGCATRSGW